MSPRRIALLCGVAPVAVVGALCIAPFVVYALGRALYLYGTDKPRLAAENPEALASLHRFRNALDGFGRALACRVQLRRRARKCTRRVDARNDAE